MRKRGPRNAHNSKVLKLWKRKVLRVSHALSRGFVIWTYIQSLYRSLSAILRRLFIPCIDKKIYHPTNDVSIYVSWRTHRNSLALALMLLPSFFVSLGRTVGKRGFAGEVAPSLMPSIDPLVFSLPLIFSLSLSLLHSPTCFLTLIHTRTRTHSQKHTTHTNIYFHRQLPSFVRRRSKRGGEWGKGCSGR